MQHNVVMSAFDAAVVGGGLVGTALAYELAGAGMRTVLVDRHDPARATDAGAGILSPETITDKDDTWVALATAAGEYYPTLVAELDALGAPGTGFANCGALRLAFRAWDDEPYAKTTAQILRRAGGIVHELDAGDAQAMFPPLGEVRAALYNPRAARIDGRRVTASLRHGAEVRGATLHAGSVERFVVRHGRVEAIETGTARLACGSVVIAGGAWTPALGDQLGVQLPIFPVRGQIVHLRTPEAPTGEWPILQPVLSCYIVPRPEGRFAVGGTVEPDAGFDARPTAAGMRQLLSELLTLAPGLSDATFVEVRVGLRPVSVDDSPVVGRVPRSDNAFVLSGHGANGLLLGPYSARLVTQLMVGEPPQLDLGPFGPQRFFDPSSPTARGASSQV